MRILFLNLVIQYLSQVVQFFSHRGKLTVWFFIIVAVFFWKPVLVLCQESVITPTVTIKEKYESNPRFVEVGEDDWVASTVVSPELTFYKSYKKSNFGGSLGAGLAFYPGNSEFNNEEYSASLRINLAHSPRTKFAIKEDFSFSDDSLRFDPDPESITDTTGILVQRSDILSNRLVLSMRHSKSPAITLGLTLSDRRKEYDLSTLSDTRSVSIKPIVEIDKAINEKTDLLSSYDFTRFYIESGDSNVTIDTHSLSVGVDHRITPGFSFTASVGAVYSPESGFDFGLVGDLELSKYTRRSQISLIYSRRPNVSSFSNDLNITQAVSVELLSKLTKDVNGSVGAGIRKNESKTSNTVDVISYYSGVNISWQAYSWVNVDGGYTYSEQESDDTLTGDITRNTFFVSLRFIPAVWRF